MKLTDAFKNRRVLVTGHTGAEVHGFALPPHTNPSHFDLCRMNSKLHHLEGDLRDGAAVDAAFSRVQPELVFHLGAQALVRDSYIDPKATFDINVGGVVNVLEGVRKTPSVRAVVIVTSDKCYENREWEFAYRETDPMGGHDPYSASKGAAELVTAAYQRSFFGPAAERKVGIASVRAGNVIGGGDWSSNRLIPDCVRSLTAGQPVTLRNPGSVRPWQHVLEPIGGYLQVAARLAQSPERYSTAFNFGPDGTSHLKVMDLAEGFVKVWGSGTIEAPPSDPDAPHEANLLKLSCERAQQLLGWTPKLSGLETLEWTAQWYRAWSQERAGADLSDLSLRQIRAYQSRLPASL
jgi:CDP-glucose 4,6-dehydratase